MKMIIIITIIIIINRNRARTCAHPVLCFFCIVLFSPANHALGDFCDLHVRNRNLET